MSDEDDARWHEVDRGLLRRDVTASRRYGEPS